MDKIPPANAEYMSLIPDPGRFHMSRSNQAGAPQLQSLNSRAREPQLLKPECLEPVLHKRTTTIRSLSTPRKSKFHSLQLEKSPHSDDPAQPKINKVEKKKVLNIPTILSRHCIFSPYGGKLWLSHSAAGSFQNSISSRTKCSFRM